MQSEAEFEEMMILEEEMVRGPRTIDKILDDLRRTESEDRAERLKDELFHRIAVQFDLEDEEASAVFNDLLQRVGKD